ncbi:MULTISPECIES: hypothetical protein [Lactobacillus]|uniref:Uncharacterized protein n=1 Tax=Lactobacillus xujianguonis TaxID=2495899 RepID=A0A437SWD0_9LACO|nr:MULTISPECIES: hypothetical protein [Lactobacillus]RVU71229.1 hypothetical protein EJK17_03260 [Lactobacillus xujianguonis]
MSSRIVYQSEKTRLQKSSHRWKIISLILFLLSAAQLMATVYFNRDDYNSENQRQIRDQQEQITELKQELNDSKNYRIDSDN